MLNRLNTMLHGALHFEVTGPAGQYKILENISFNYYLLSIPQYTRVNFTRASGARIFSHWLVFIDILEHQ